MRKSLIVSAVLASALLADNTLELEKITIATKTQKSIDGVAATVEVVTQEER